VRIGQDRCALQLPSAIPYKTLHGDQPTVARAPTSTQMVALPAHAFSSCQATISARTPATAALTQSHRNGMQTIGAMLPR
jgi:hypothetical protein